MSRAVNAHLDSMARAMERLQKSMPKLSLKEKVDLGARVRAIYNAAEKLDAAVKEEIVKHLHGEDGTVPGIVFKAVRGSSDVTRVDQAYLEVNHPRIYQKCLHTNSEARILYSPR